MKPLSITVAIALLILASTWLLVRTDVLAASALRFLPAVLAFVAAGGIVYAAVHTKRADKPLSKTRRRKK